jgi:hypothetical protein
MWICAQKVLDAIVTKLIVGHDPFDLVLNFEDTIK